MRTPGPLQNLALAAGLSTNFRLGNVTEGTVLDCTVGLRKPVHHPSHTYGAGALTRCQLWGICPHAGKKCLVFSVPQCLSGEPDPYFSAPLAEPPRRIRR